MNVLVVVKQVLKISQMLYLFTTISKEVSAKFQYCQMKIIQIEKDKKKRRSN